MRNRITYIKGSILDAPQIYIAHGVNCQNKMGSGVAKVLFEKYPEIKYQYHELWEYVYPLVLDTNKLLGMVQPVEVHDNKIVFNCFTQDYFGYDGNQYADYSAIKTCLLTIRKNYGNIKIAMPKIGCGLGGLDWSKVEKTLLEVKGLTYFIYNLE